MREQVFSLVYAGKFTYADVELMTAEERAWYVMRLDKQLKTEAAEMKKASNARRGRRR